MDRIIGTGEGLELPLEVNTSKVVVLRPGKLASDTTDLRVAAAFVQSVADGAAVTEAAQAAGLSVTAAQRSSVIRQALATSLQQFQANHDETREYVRLKWLEISIMAEDPKERMAALHELSLIPEVGLKSPRGRPAGERVLSDETLALLDEEG